MTSPSLSVFCDFVLASEIAGKAVTTQLAALSGTPEDESSPIFKALSVRSFSTPAQFWDTQSTTGLVPDILVWDSSFDKPLFQQGTSLPRLLLWGKQPNDAHPLPDGETFTKPVAWSLFLYRLGIIARDILSQKSAPHYLGAWKYHASQNYLIDPETDFIQRLTDKEAMLLRTLLKASTPMTKDQLLSTLWGHSVSLETHTLETHLYNLRQKLMSIPSQLPDPFVLDDAGYSLHSAWKHKGD